MQQEQKIKGFTILELLVVITIVSIVSAIGYPIIGDKKYTKKSQLVTDNGQEKLQLHARGIIFQNPISGKLINVKCPPPVHMKKFLHVDEIDEF